MRYDSFLHVIQKQHKEFSIIANGNLTEYNQARDQKILTINKPSRKSLPARMCIVKINNLTLHIPHIPSNNYSDCDRLSTMFDLLNFHCISAVLPVVLQDYIVSELSVYETNDFITSSLIYAGLDYLLLNSTTLTRDVKVSIRSTLQKFPLFKRHILVSYRAKKENSTSTRNIKKRRISPVFHVKDKVVRDRLKKYPSPPLKIIILLIHAIFSTCPLTITFALSKLKDTVYFSEFKSSIFFYVFSAWLSVLSPFDRTKLFSYKKFKSLHCINCHVQVTTDVRKHDHIGSCPVISFLSHYSDILLLRGGLYLLKHTQKVYFDYHPWRVILDQIPSGSLLLSLVTNDGLLDISASDEDLISRGVPANQHGRPSPIGSTSSSSRTI